MTPLPVLGNSRSRFVTRRVIPTRKAEDLLLESCN